jgi:uncharacterized protein DUF3823
MKISFHYLGIFTIVAALSGCKKDNYTAPSSILSGHVSYKGEAIQLERNQVPFQIYQYGFGKVGPIGETFDQSGGYSAVLFDGNYKIIVPTGQGPFLWKQTGAGNPDTVNVALKGTQSLDLEVTPYYMIRNPQLSAAGGKVTAIFKAEKIITDANAKNIERVSLYINKSEFVSGGDNVAAIDLAGSSITDVNNISLTVSIPTLVPAQNYVYARVGLKIVGLEDLIFSPLQKISF